MHGMFSIITSSFYKSTIIISTHFILYETIVLYNILWITYEFAQLEGYFSTNGRF